MNKVNMEVSPEEMQMILDQRKPEKWSCPKGEIHLGYSNALFHNTTNSLTQLIGNDYSTEAEAQEAVERREWLEIPNRFKLEQNKLTGFVPDWDDFDQVKYDVVYSYSTGMYEIDINYTYQNKTIVYCDLKSAKLLAQMLNDNLIEGLEQDDE